MAPDIYYHILEIGFRFEKGRKDGKADAYEALQKLHNIPRAMHGTDALGTAVPITLAEVKKYTDRE